MSATKLPPEESAPQESASVRPLLVVLIALCSLFIVTYAFRLDERERVEVAIAQQQDANAEATARSAALEAELRRAVRPSYLDQLIRDYLDYGKPGDVRIVAIDAASLAAGAALHSPTGAAAHREIWQQWLDLFLHPGTPASN